MSNPDFRRKNKKLQNAIADYFSFNSKTLHRRRPERTFRSASVYMSDYFLNVGHPSFWGARRDVI